MSSKQLGEFTDQKALRDYAELHGLQYVWEGTSEFRKRRHLALCRLDIINWLPWEPSTASGACCCSQAQSSAQNLKRAVEWEAPGRSHLSALHRKARSHQRSAP
jgi:hypothetical protein